MGIRLRSQAEAGGPVRRRLRRVGAFLLVGSLALTGCFTLRVRVDHPATDFLGFGPPLDDPSLDPFRFAGFVVLPGRDTDIRSGYFDVTLYFRGEGDPSTVEVIEARIVSAEVIQIPLDSVQYVPYRPGVSSIGRLRIARLQGDPVTQIRRARPEPVLEVVLALNGESRRLVYQLQRVGYWLFYITR